MAETVLNTIKILLELDTSEDTFDNELLLYINFGVQYLIKNKIPLVSVTSTTETDDFTYLNSGDIDLVLEWLHLYCLQRFDRTLIESSGSTSNWIDSELENIIYLLKTNYDKLGDDL